MKGYLKLLVLSRLKKNSMTGVDIMNMIESALGKKPSSGSVYPMLKNLTEKGYISFVENKNSKIYSINEIGESFVLDLIKEKEKGLITLARILNHVQGISEKNYSDTILAIEDEKIDYDNVMHNVDIWLELTSLLIVLEKKNKGDIDSRNNVRVILEDTFCKLKEVLNKK